MGEVDQLKKRLREFAQARDWEQFHSPKNLAMALSVEVSELLEHFQWLTEAQSMDVSDKVREEIAMEIADVFVYLLRLSDQLGIDPVKSAARKIEINEQRYPVALSRGKAGRPDKSSE